MGTGLSQILEDTLTRLRRAGADSRAQWRLPVLATYDAERGPQARTVVLRNVAVEPLHLSVYTDRRSAKAGQIAADDRVTLVFWDKSASLQLRADGRATLLTEEPEVAAARARLRGFEGADYARRAAPGAPLDQPEAGDDTLADALAHFSVMEIAVRRLDWLSLAREGQRRAMFTLEDGAWTGAWHAP